MSAGTGGFAPRSLGVGIVFGALGGGLAGCLAIAPDGAAGQGGGPVPVEVRQRLEGNCPGPGRPGDDGVVATAFQAADTWRGHLAAPAAGRSSPAVPAPLAAVLGTWRVDFSAGESVVRLDAGARPNPGHRLKVADAETVVQGDLLVISGSVELPAPGSIQAQVITFPCVYLHLGPANYRRIEIAGG